MVKHVTGSFLKQVVQCKIKITYDWLHLGCSENAGSGCGVGVRGADWGCGVRGAGPTKPKKIKIIAKQVK